MPGHQASRTLRALRLSCPWPRVLWLGCSAVPRPIGSLFQATLTMILWWCKRRRLRFPEPDPNAGFADAETGTPGLPTTRGQTAAAGSPQSAATPVGSWSRVATVEVRG